MWDRTEGQQLPRELDRSVQPFLATYHDREAVSQVCNQAFGVCREVSPASGLLGRLRHREPEDSAAALGVAEELHARLA